MSSALIIGGGIGGLTAALALAGKGWEVTVIERAPVLLPVGYALLISPNGLRALDAVSRELVEEIHGLAAIQGDGGVRDGRGRWLTRNDAAIALERYGHPAVVVRRAALIEMLASRLPAAALRLGSTVRGVNAETGYARLESGEMLHADLVVAADGMRSATRAALFSGHPGPEFLGMTTWQSLVPGDGLDVRPGTTWGRGGEFGTLPLSDGQIYAFANARADALDSPRSGVVEKAELLHRFHDDPDPIPEVIARMEPEVILRSDVYAQRVPLPALHRGRVAILGDAAHAMAPNLGQGACQAIEDAVTLAYCVTAADIADGLEKYTAARLPRTSLILRRSELVGRLATMRNPVAQGLRNTMLRTMGLAGPSAALRQADFVMRWEHPALTHADGAR